MEAAADAQLYLNAATVVFPFDITCEQLLAFPIIDVLIEGLDQQFAASLAEGHYLIFCEFISSAIEGFCQVLSRVFSTALLYCDENSRAHQVRSQSDIWEKTGVLQFLVRSLHAAQTLVELVAARFRQRSVDEQPVARLCFGAAGS